MLALSVVVVLSDNILSDHLYLHDLFLATGICANQLKPVKHWIFRDVEIVQGLSCFLCTWLSPSLIPCTLYDPLSLEPE